MKAPLDFTLTLARCAFLCVGLSCAAAQSVSAANQTTQSPFSSSNITKVSNQTALPAVSNRTALPAVSNHTSLPAVSNQTALPAASNRTTHSINTIFNVTNKTTLLLVSSQTTVSPKPGVCPIMHHHFFGCLHLPGELNKEDCRTDKDCQEDLKCCLRCRKLKCRRPIEIDD